ncbi:hypothetical protein [Thalassiella azotivora]
MTAAHRLRPARPLAALATVALSAVLLTGCGEDALRQVADDAASAAGDAASTAAVDAVRDQVCQVVGDRQVSQRDVEVLRGLSDAARAAGVESGLLDALEDVAGTDGTPPESAVARLAEECGVTPTS